MKALCSCLVLSILTLTLSLAQTPSSTTKPTKSTSAVRPPATRPAATDTPLSGQSTSSGTTTNRQQELYDQYHGVTKKTTTPTTTAAPVATRPVAAEPVSQPMASVSSPSDGSTSGFRIGIRGGVTYPIYLEKQVGIDPAIGFVGGLTFNFGAGAVSFQPEINYARLSAKANLVGFQATIAGDQIQVPLLIKFSSGTYESNRFFLNVGPYGAYLASASLDGKKVDLNGSNGRFSYGAAAGIGAALKAGSGHFTVEVRGLYQLGTTDGGFSTDSKTILSQATLGYVFPLGGQ